MTELNIIPECYVDTKVAEITGRAKRTYNHQHGCGNVANKLKELLNEIAIGIIDEDAKKVVAQNIYLNLLFLGKKTTSF